MNKQINFIPDCWLNKQGNNLTEIGLVNRILKFYEAATTGVM